MWCLPSTWMLLCPTSTGEGSRQRASTWWSTSTWSTSRRLHAQRYCRCCCCWQLTGLMFDGSFAPHRSSNIKQVAHFEGPFCHSTVFSPVFSIVSSLYVNSPQKWKGPSSYFISLTCFLQKQRAKPPISVKFALCDVTEGTGPFPRLVTAPPPRCLFSLLSPACSHYLPNLWKGPTNDSVFAGVCHRRPAALFSGDPQNFFLFCFEVVGNWVWIVSQSLDSN